MSLSDLEIKKLYSALMGYAYSLSKSQTLMHDLVHDTLIKQMDQNHSNLAFDNIKYWCMGVLRNRFNDIMKKKTEDQFNPEDLGGENYHDPASGVSAFSNLLYNDCMEQLKPEHRGVMLENVPSGKTTAEIAEDIGKPQNTILTWLTKQSFNLETV